MISVACIDPSPPAPFLQGNLVVPGTAPRTERIVPTTICLIVALTPLVFAAWLFEPYVAAKEIFVQAGTATAALLWLITARHDKLTFPRTSIWWPLIALGMIGLGSLIWTSNSAASLGEIQRLVTYALLFAVTLHVMKDVDNREKLAAILMLAGGLEAMYVLVQYFYGDPLFAARGLRGKWQMFGTLGNPNWTGEFLAVAALVSLGRLTAIRAGTSRLSSARYPATYLAFLTLLATVTALAATLARGAWIAFIIGTVAFAVVRSKSIEKWNFKPLLLPVMGTVATVVLAIAPPLVSNGEAIKHLFNLKSINGRLLMSVASWAMIRDRVWLGHGLGTYSSEFPSYQAQILSYDWAAYFVPNASFTTYAHNDYLQLWAETGLLGVLAFGVLVVMVLSRGWRLSRDPLALGCWAAVVSLLINAVVGFPFHLPTTLMLFIVLVAVIEATASKKIVDISKLPIAARGAIVLVILTLCLSASRLSYYRFVSESALWQADAALDSERWNEAEAEIDRAVRHAPNRMEGQAMLGRLHNARGEYELALLTSELAQTLGYGVEVYDVKATALEALGRRADAIAILNELTRLRPDLHWPRERSLALRIALESQRENDR